MSRISFRILVGLVVSFFVLQASAVRSQKINICVQFNTSVDITESNGAKAHVSPSGFDPADRSVIIDQVKTLFERVFGAGNVSVQDATSSSCSGKIVFVNGGNGPGGEYGDANVDNRFAVVHVGQFVKDGFANDTLTSAIAESIAHQAAHLYHVDHGHDANSIMVSGDSISVARRMADHRGFSSADSAELVRNANTTASFAPALGDFKITPNLMLKSPILDDRGFDLRISTDKPTMQIGIITTSGDLMVGRKFDPTVSDYSLTLFGEHSIDYGIKLDGKILSSSMFGSYKVADRDPMSGLYSLGLLQFDRGPAQGSNIFVDMPPLNQSGGISPTFNFYLKNGPHIGDVLYGEELADFDVYVTPNYLYIEGNYDSYDYWDAPEGTEIVDGALAGEFINPFTGDEEAYYWVLLDDGECILLEFETCGECGATSIYDDVSLPPILQRNGIASAMFDGPITVVAGGSVYRYDSVHTTWVSDTAGFRSAYLAGMAGDKNGNLYAATTRGLFTQRDTSLTWTQLTFPGNPPQSVFVSRTGTIIAADYSNPYFSTDHGATWTKNNSGLPNGFYPVSFGDDAFGNIYLIENSYSLAPQLYKSAGGTGPWTQVAQTVTAASGAQVLTFNRIKGDTELYLATQFGVYRSTDQGATWAAYNNGIRTSAYYSILKTPQNQLVLGTDGGIYKGYYQDTTWQKLWPRVGFQNQSRRPIQSDAVGNLYTLGTKLSGYNNFGNAIAKSTDGGVTWTEDSSFTDAKQAGQFFIDPSGKEYIATNGFQNNPTHIYSKTGNGAWVLDEQGFAASPRGNYPTTFISDGSNVYFASIDSVFGVIWKYSGGSWSIDTAGLGDQIYTLAWDGHMLYAGGVVADHYFSGGKWNSMPLPKTVPSGANLFYVSADTTSGVFSSFYTIDNNGNYVSRGVYFTKDLGQHWTRALPDSIQINGLYSYKDTTYVITTKGVFAYTSRLYSTSYVPEGSHNGRSTTIHFGAVKSGTTATLPFRIANFGNDLLRVFSATSSNPAFTISSFPDSAGPQQVTHSLIQFHPQTNGGAQGMFVLSSNSETGNDTIFVDGAGAAGGSVGGVAEDGFFLSNYPNPFGSMTTINYTLPERSNVSLEVFDVLGHAVRTLASGSQDTGDHILQFYTLDLADGVYICRLDAGNAVRSIRIVVKR